jgi:hypothetical protein
MDYTNLIQNLRAQRDRLQRAIDELERLQSGPAPSRRRGRKSMGADERARVSDRMRNYWAARRTARETMGAT